jgi:cell division protein FtsI/penicillin-binding protein 2
MKTRAFQSRCLALCSVIVAGLSLLSVRLFQIQVWDRKQVAGKSNPFDQAEVLPGLRGNIVDRNDEVLAKSMPVGSVYADVYHLTNPQVMATMLAFEQVSQMPGWNELNGEKRLKRVAAERSKIEGAMIASGDPEGVAIREAALARIVSLLARPLGMRREELRKILVDGIGKKTKGEFAIVKNLPDDVARLVQETIDEHWVEGIFLRHSYRRTYSSEMMATHIIGYTGEVEEKGPTGRPSYRQIGKFGIESSLEEYLAGRDGCRIERRDPRGMRIPGESQSVTPPRPGLNVQLTIDMGIQAIVEEELEAGLVQFKSERGCAIVMDPDTGEILGMASRPHFNLNRLDNLDVAGSNFALQAIYEPGSTIKIVAAGGALNEKLVSPQTSVFCHNGYYKQGSVLVEDRDHPYGYLTVEGILQKSSNIGSYKLAQQLGMARFYDYMGKWGYGKKTGILLSGESRGVIRNTGNPTDFSRAAYGYALAVTPLQVASAYCVVAGDGKLRKPQIVRSIIANDGTVVQKFEPETTGTVLRPETAKMMRKALRKVTDDEGTAKLARVPGYLVGGKTGTALRIKDGVYQRHNYVASFAGMLPAEDPAFVCVVVIDDPKLAGKNPYGGLVAAPIFANIGRRAAAHMNLPPTEPVGEGKDKLAGTQDP